MEGGVAVLHGIEKEAIAAINSAIAAGRISRAVKASGWLQLHQRIAERPSPSARLPRKTLCRLLA